MELLSQCDGILHIEEEMRLTIVFQFGGRKYLERISRDFLKESLGAFKDYEWVELDCSGMSIGEGFNRLASQVKTEYVLYAQDDFGFFPNGDWVEKAIKILENRKDIGIIDLRKERDNETPWAIDSREWIDDMSFFTIYSWENRRFNLTPFIMRTEDLKKIVPLDESQTRKNGAEYSGIENYRAFVNLKLARLDILYMGVCFHLGWNRSRELGYEEKCPK